MNIQTISIVVPTKGCVNKCPICVSRMHENSYADYFDEFQITKRIKWAVMNGVNTCIITGTGEAFQNYHFLGRLADIFKKMNYPFPNVEFQTTGVMLEDYDETIGGKTGNLERKYYNISILKELGVSTISLSVSNVFDSARNADLIDMPEKLRFLIPSLCRIIKENGFNLRLSLNMYDHYDVVHPKEIIDACKKLGADQITFRKLYYGNDNSEQTQYVKLHRCEDETIQEIKNYIQGYIEKEEDGFGPFEFEEENFVPGNGKLLYKLPFGASVYSIEGMSTVIDDDCMSKENNGSLKYCILRENGKLYAQWDDEGSLIF
jgi:hypothetical protein